MSAILPIKKNVVETESTSQVTLLTLVEDALGGGLVDNYAVGGEVTVVSRSQADSYQGMKRGYLYFARASGVIETLDWDLISGAGAGPTIAVSDEAPNIAIKITPLWTAKTIHRIWAKLYCFDDAYSV